MTSYFLRRFLLIIPTFIGITLVVFTILQFCPGNIVQQEVERIQSGGTTGGELSTGSSGGGVKDIEKIRKRLERQYGFDRPLLVQYADWFSQLIGLSIAKNPYLFNNVSDFNSMSGLVAKFQKGADPLSAALGPQLAQELAKLQATTTTDLVDVAEEAICRVLNRTLDNRQLYQMDFFQKIALTDTIKTLQAKKKPDWLYLNRLLLEAAYPEEIAPSDTKMVREQRLKGTFFATMRIGKLFCYWHWPYMGQSYIKKKPILDMIIGRLPVSITVGLIGFLLTYLICIPLGVMKAVRHGSAFDFTSSALIFIAYAVPGWTLGLVLLVWLGGDWGLFPLGGVTSPNFDTLSSWGKFWDLCHHGALPIFCYMLGNFATLTILMKNSLLENLSADYIRTAFAKGLSEKRVIFLHALRNSMIPLATGLGHALSLILAGSYLIERVFNINGFGLLGYTAIENRDYPLALGILVIGSLLRLLGNIFSDMLYCLFDPRIRFE